METFEERMERRQAHYKRRLDYVTHKLKYMKSSLDDSAASKPTKTTPKGKLLALLKV